MNQIVCNICDKKMSKIVYGYPNEELLELAKTEGWILGGCMPSPVTFYCKECKNSWSTDLGFDKES